MSSSVYVPRFLYDEESCNYILFESQLFGDKLSNEKLGFSKSVIGVQCTVLPKLFHIRHETLEKNKESDKYKDNHILFMGSEKPKYENESRACDPNCPHLVVNKADCYVQAFEPVNKAIKLNKSSANDSILLPHNHYVFRASVWGDVSMVKSDEILKKIEEIIQGSKRSMLYSVNPPPILKPYFMKSSSYPFEVLDSLNKGESVYFGDKSELVQGAVKRMLKASKYKAVHCLSLGDGSPFLPTCSTCKTPCNAQTFDSPFVILSPNKGKIEKVLSAKKKRLGILS